MATTVFLIRHAPHADLDRRLSGRLPGLTLTEDGRARAARLARALADRPIARVQASPLERAMETAGAIADVQGVAPVEPCDAIAEIDFGDWTGRDFAELDGDVDWRRWNERRAEGRAPGGETMAAAQERAVAHLFAAADEQEGKGAIAMVSHCDIIRGAVAHVLGLSLDRVHDFEIAPASVTELSIDGGRARLVRLNEGVA